MNSISIFLVNFRQTNDNDDDTEESITYLSHFVHLPNIIELEFVSTTDISQWKDIHFILKYVTFIYFYEL